MNNQRDIKLTLLYGFMMIMSIHFGMVILEKLFSNIAMFILEYADLVYLRLLFLPLELFLILKFLLRFSVNPNKYLKFILKLTLVFILFSTLFLLRSNLMPNDVGIYSCGNTTSEEIEAYFLWRGKYIGEANKAIQIIEMIVISVSLLFYIIKTIKKKA